MAKAASNNNNKQWSKFVQICPNWSTGQLVNWSTGQLVNADRKGVMSFCTASVEQKTKYYWRKMNIVPCATSVALNVFQKNK